MQKIAIFCPKHFFPIPSIYGGACEELLTILVDENEKQGKVELSIFQQEFEQDKMEVIGKYKYNHTKRIYFKQSKISNFIRRCFNKLFKTLKIKYRFLTSYESQFVKYCVKNKFDKIIFEANGLSDSKKLLKHYDKSKIYFHSHIQYLNKEKEYRDFGNIIPISEFISNDWRVWLDKNNFGNVRTLTLPNTVNPDKFNKIISDTEKEDLRKNLGFTLEDFVVVFCGRIVEIKGIRELIKSIIPLEKNIKLLIIGSPDFSRVSTTPFLTEIESLVEKNKEKIKFTGFIPNNELYKYYQIADIQAVPSTCEEAAGLVAIEGMMSGLPLVITNSGGLPEYVAKDGSIMVTKENNLVLELSNTILDLYNNPEKRKEMSQANLIHSQNYTTTKFYNDFIEIINK